MKATWGKTTLFLCLLAGVELTAAEFYREDFSNPEALKKTVIREHGAPETLQFADGTVILDNLGARQGSRIRLRDNLPAELDVSWKMKFLDAKPRGGYAGIIFQRPKPGERGMGISLTDNGGYLQVDVAPKYAIEYFQLAKVVDGWHKIRVTAKNGKLRIRVDGEIVLDRSGVPLQGGSLCFRNWECKAAFDDLQVNPPEESAMAVRNLLANGSFEEAVSPNMPYAWGIASWGLAEDKLLADLPRFRQEWRRDPVNPKHGKYCMRVGMTNLLASCYVPVQTDADYLLSAWVRGRTAGKTLRIRYVTLQGSRCESHDKTVSLSPEWQRVVWPLPRTKLNMAAVYFYGPEGEEYYVDAVSLTQGTGIPDGYVESASGSTENKEDLPELTAPYVAGAPDLDKLLADPLWKKAAKFTLKTTSGAEPKDKTEGYLMYNDGALYAAMRCYDAAPATMKAAVTQHDGTVWADDCIEFFLAPTGRHRDWNDYYHLGVSLSGARFDGHKTDPAWNLDWQARTRRTADGWEAVAAIPFAGLSLNDNCRGDWIVNFCRENPRTKEYSAWSPTYGSFHTAERFGTLKALAPEVLSRWIASDTAAADNANRTAVIPLRKKGNPHLAIGVTWQSIHLPGEAIFRELQKAGMNRLVWAVATRTRTPGEIRRVLDAAQKYGIDVTFWILGEHTAMGIPVEKWPEQIVRTIRACKDHPAIADWMVLDEPHSHGEVVRAAVECAKKEDPTRPVFINVTPHGLGLRIGGLPGDLLCIDRYGFFFDGSTLADVGITARSVVRVARETGRPAAMCLQGMGHDLWVPRCPTPDEMTAQSYLALIAGCTGFYYFNAMVFADDTWQQMQVLAGEFKRLFPVVISPEIAEVRCANENIHFMARHHQGRTFLIAVNQSREAQHVVFDCGGKVRSGKDFFNGRQSDAPQGRLAVNFKPMERKVYELY